MVDIAVVIGVWGIVIIRAGTGTCPYNGVVDINVGGAGNHNNAMDVVWHDDKCIGFDTDVMRRQIIPHRLNHLSRIIQYHFTIASIIISLQSNRTAMADFQIISHISFPSDGHLNPRRALIKA